MRRVFLPVFWQVFAAALLSICYVSANAQETPQAGAPSAQLILILDIDLVIAQSELGKAIIERVDENQIVVLEREASVRAELTAEEDALAERRETMKPAEFVVLAEAFDQKAETKREEFEQFINERAATYARWRNRFRDVIVDLSGQFALNNNVTMILTADQAIWQQRSDITGVIIQTLDVLYAENKEQYEARIFEDPSIETTTEPTGATNEQ